MKKVIITDGNNVITHIGDLLGVQEDTGFTELTIDASRPNNTRIAFAYNINAYPDVDIPNDLGSEIADVYCYTKERGFYNNPNYISPEEFLKLDSNYCAGYDQAVLDMINDGIL